MPPTRKGRRPRRRRREGVAGGIAGRLGAYFDLIRTDENRVYWSHYSPWLGASHVDVSVGLDDASTFASARGRLALQFVRPQWAAIVAIPSALLGLAIAYFGLTTALLRDGTTADTKPGTFSLARSQMAF